MKKLIASIACVLLAASCSSVTNDLGIIEINNLEGLEWENLLTDVYPEGTEFTCVVVVENLGSETQQDVLVNLVVYDVNADPDSLVWHNVQVIESIEKRSLGKSDIVEVEFPVFTTPSENWFRFDCWVDLEDDENPENDEYTTSINMGIAEDNVEKPYAIETIYPNPARESVMVSFRLAMTTHVTITVKDSGGSTVIVLVDEQRPAGRHRMTWDLTNTGGSKVPAGTYVFIMEIEEFEDFLQERQLTIVD